MFTVLQERYRTVLAHLDAVEEVLLPPVAHPHTLQVPMGGNSMRSNIQGSFTAPDTLGYRQHTGPDTAPGHELLPEASDLPIVHPVDHRLRDPKVNRAVVDGFVLTEVIAAHRHMVPLGGRPLTAPVASYLTFV